MLCIAVAPLLLLRGLSLIAGGEASPSPFSSKLSPSTNCEGEGSPSVVSPAYYTVRRGLLRPGYLIDNGTAIT
jgi:hypothetical protein